MKVVTIVKIVKEVKLVKVALWSGVEAELTSRRLTRSHTAAGF